MFVAVTGANGHVGQHVVRALLDEGHHVRTLDRTSSDHTDHAIVDATDYHQLANAVHGADALIHLAGIPNPLDHDGHIVHDTNVTASYHALTAAVEHHIPKVCLASSINAIGGAFSSRAHYDYFPVDEQHPTYAEDPYSLSKWIAEQQADSITRRHNELSVASLRLHGATEDRAHATAGLALTDPTLAANHLWGYVRYDAVADAFLRALRVPWHGHEVFNIVAGDTAVTDTDSHELAHQHWPNVPLRRDLPGHSGFYDCRKAERLLGWRHPT